ncbi:HAD family hydrolase [Brevibacillus ginsengisoli]|uniref:HAD family hydrolase n=1 Tax=Brevibacillus ginsengisoli TaxID=363854 RepID=UPI003CECDEDE
MYRCLLFDLDGTLLDTRDAVIDAVFRTAEHYAPGRFTQTELISRFGESFDDFLAEAAVGFNHEEVLQTYYANVREQNYQQSQLFPFVQEGLSTLRDTGMKLGIVTNKQREFALSGLQSAGILDYFDCVVCVDDVSSGKPSPEPLHKALETLQLSAEDALLIGDTQYDLLAARAAGVRCAILEWYGTQVWADAEPDCRFANFQDFVQEIVTVKLTGR